MAELAACSGQAVCDRFSVTSRFRDRAWPSENFVALKNLDAALLRMWWLFFTGDNDPTSHLICRLEVPLYYHIEWFGHADTPLSCFLLPNQQKERMRYEVQ